jgi:hypothetical protein
MRGLAALLLIAGVILFFFPEPVTSVIGVVVLLAAIGSWLFGGTG